MCVLYLFQFLCFVVWVLALFASFVSNSPVEFMVVQIISLLLIIITDRFDINVQKRNMDYQLVNTVDPDDREHDIDNNIV